VAYVLSRSQEIPAPAGEVFAFFSDPHNLARITPPWLRFRIHGERPVTLDEGGRIEYRIAWTLFTLRWVTRIVSWDPPVRFIDEQERGPYRTWIHEHRFTPTASGVRMDDRVEYELPFGPLGRLVHSLVVRRQLEEIFDYRRRSIDDIFSPAGNLAVEGTLSPAGDLAVPQTPAPPRSAAAR
jgi:ligand-binding SRPBCC domain-containing protein